VLLPNATPEPDAYGTYWLCPGPYRLQGPVIFQSKVGRRKKKMEEGEKPRWFVSLGMENGLVFDGPKLRYFESVNDALRFLKAYPLADPCGEAL
jgi:hypothetical protein